jgi:fibronectin-binding autotransporter adhesin
MSSNGLLVQPDGAKTLEADDLYRQLMQIVGRDLGLADWGSKITHTSFSSNSEYAHTIQNQGTGGHLNIPSILQVTNSGVTVSTLGVSGNVTIAGTLAAGASTLASLGVTGAATVGGTLGVTGATTLAGLTAGATTLASLGVTGAATVGGLTTTTLTATGNTTLGNELTDTVLISGDLTVNRDISVQRNLDVDGTTVLSTTTIVGAGAGNDQALFLKHNSGAGQFTLGATNAADPVLVFKDHSGDQTFEVGNNSSTYQAKVTGDFNVSDDSVFDGDISASRAVIGGTTFSGTEELRVVGQTRLEGATEITTGSLTVAGGISAGASSAFTGGLTVVTGGLTVSAGGADINGAVAITNDTSTTAMLFLGAAAFTQTTVGAAGGASAMPTPDGYLRVNVKGGSRVIPYCNA